MSPSRPVDRLECRPLIAILRGITPDEVLSHADAILAAGIDAIEVPTNSPDWAISVRLLVHAYGHRALIGAGTVLCEAHLDHLIAAGGRLVVTPHVDADVIASAAARGLSTAIGCMTPSEAFAALRAGADALKIFPAASVGPAHVKAIRSVLPAGTPLYAVGGVSPDSLPAYLAAGCCGAGLGSELYRPGQTADQTATRAAQFVAAYQRHFSHHQTSAP